MSLRLLTAGMLALSSLATVSPVAAAKPAAATTQALTVSGGYVAEAPPGARVMAAFMQLRNPGKTAVTVTGVSSPAFGRVELHETRQQGGMARMAKLERLTIQPGATVTLAHGGKHVMLFHPKQALKAGDSVSLTFRFDGAAKPQTVTLPVRADDGGAGHHHGHDGHGHDSHGHHH